MDHGVFELFPTHSKKSVYSRVSDISALDETFGSSTTITGRSSDYQYDHSSSRSLDREFEDTTEILNSRRSTIAGDAIWLPGILKHVPWLGLCALGISISCMAVSIGVLTTSNGRLVTSWRVQPTVFLAVASATANVTLQLSLAQGVTISWWYKAMRGGTVGDLHRHCSFGDNLWSTLTAGRHFNKLALATIIVSVAVIDGPLLQRASTIVPKEITVPISMNASIAQQLPIGYTSTMLGRVEYPVALTTPFADVMQDYSRRAPITTDFEGCMGKCSTVIQAAGFSIDCQPPVRTPVDYEPEMPLSNGSFPSSAFDPQPLFSVDLTWSSGVDEDIIRLEGRPTNAESVPEQVILSVGYSDTADCKGSFVTKNCTLTESIVDYQLSLVNNTVTLNNPDINLHVVSKGNSTPDIMGGYMPGENITLGGFALAGADLFTSNTSLRFVGAAGMWQVEGFNTFASQYIVNATYLGNCQFGWKDPTDDILSALHEIMFRTALKASNAADSVFVQNGQGNHTFHTKQTLQATQTSVQNVFLSHFGYLGGALAVMTLGVLSVLPTFNGWWHLGRPMTLSPIETAKAFNAPILSTQPSHSNASVRQLMKDVGAREVRYGEVTVAARLYSNGEKGASMTRIGRKPVGGRRLEMAHPDGVIRPRKGAKFDA